MTKIDNSNILTKMVLRFTENMEWFGKQTKQIGRKTNLTEAVGKG